MLNREVIIAIPTAFLLVGGFAGVGGAMLRRIDPREEESLRLFPIAVALGFATFSYLAYVLTLLGPVHYTVVIALSLAGILIGLPYWSSLRKSLVSWASGLPQSLGKPVLWVLLLISFGALALVGMNWLTPPKEGDAIGGYMFTARWLYSHKLDFIPWNPRYSLFPLNTELVYSLTFAFGTDLVAKFLDGLLGLTFLLAVYAFARRCSVGVLFSFLAAVSLAVMPEFNNNWSSGKVDVVSCFIFFAGISLLFYDVKGTVWRRILFASFLIGTACSQKYTHWIFALTIPVCVILVLYNQGWKVVLKGVLLSSGVILLCLLPHAAKNIAWAHNPIAPFAQKYFDPSIVTIPHTSDAIKLSNDLLQFPVTLFFGGGLSGLLPLLILIGVPLFLFVKHRPPLIRYALYIAVAQLIVWIAVRRGDWLAPRFMIVPITLLLIVAAFGTERILSHSRALRNVVAVMLIAVFAYGGIWKVRHRRESLPFIVGRENRARWQERIAPSRAYNVMHDVAPRLGPASRLMGITALYNIPDEKIPYVSTEAEVVEFGALQDSEKLAYLRANGFGYYLFTSGRKPEWADKFLRVEAKQSGSVSFTLYRVDVDSQPAQGAQLASTDLKNLISELSEPLFTNGDIDRTASSLAGC